MKYVIGSGWWCSANQGTAGKEFGLPKVGHPCIRGTDFFNVWLYFVKRYTAPLKIVVVDSASPISPPGAHTNPDYEYLSLDRNYHAVKKTRYNGWLRGFMMGAWYSWNCNADFIYIEQDCLVIGKDWVQAIYKASTGRHLLVGSRFRHPLQQSLVFIPHEQIPRFLYHLAQINKPLTCEMRFHNVGKMKTGVGYRRLPFGVGRVRPIDWKAKHLYAQHWTEAELRRLGQREQVNGMIKELLNGGKK